MNSTAFFTSEILKKRVSSLVKLYTNLRRKNYYYHISPTTIYYTKEVFILYFNYFFYNYQLETIVVRLTNMVITQESPTFSRILFTRIFEGPNS